MSKKKNKKIKEIYVTHPKDSQVGYSINGVSSLIDKMFNEKPLTDTIKKALNNLKILYGFDSPLVQEYVKNLKCYDDSLIFKTFFATYQNPNPKFSNFGDLCDVEYYSKFFVVVIALFFELHSRGRSYLYQKEILDYVLTYKPLYHLHKDENASFDERIKSLADFILGVKNKKDYEKDFDGKIKDKEVCIGESVKYLFQYFNGEITVWDKSKNKLYPLFQRGDEKISIPHIDEPIVRNFFDDIVNHQDIIYFDSKQALISVEYKRQKKQEYVNNFENVFAMFLKREEDGEKHYKDLLNGINNSDEDKYDSNKINQINEENYSINLVNNEQNIQRVDIVTYAGIPAIGKSEKIKREVEQNLNMSFNQAEIEGRIEVVDCRQNLSESELYGRFGINEDKISILGHLPRIFSKAYQNPDKDFYLILEELGKVDESVFQVLYSPLVDLSRAFHQEEMAKILKQKFGFNIKGIAIYWPSNLKVRCTLNQERVFTDSFERRFNIETLYWEDQMEFVTDYLFNVKRQSGELVEVSYKNCLNVLNYCLENENRIGTSNEIFLGPFISIVDDVNDEKQCQEQGNKLFVKFANRLKGLGFKNTHSKIFSNNNIVTGNGRIESKLKKNENILRDEFIDKLIVGKY